jgi:hypothetical protein
MLMHHHGRAIQEPSPQPSAIAASFSKCSSQFRELYLALTRKDCQVTHQVSLSRLADGYGRFGVWGGNSRADRTGRGSLDDSLRNDPSSLYSIILDLLDSLHDDLERGMSFVNLICDTT